MRYQPTACAGRAASVVGRIAYADAVAAPGPRLDLGAWRCFHGLLSLIGQLTGVWQSVATPSGLLAVGALVLAGLLALAVARMAATAAALTVAPMRRRAAAIRQKSWSARFQRLTDPDAAGRVRPRAPGAVPAAA